MAIPTYRMSQPPPETSAPIYHAEEYRRIQRTLDVLVRMAPQAATKAPPVAEDGMQRLSRSPWWPVAGQVADAWVYYDAPLGSWQFLP